MSSYRKMFFRKIRRLRALAKLARMEGIPRRGKKTRFDKQDRCRYIRSAYALQALEPAWIPVRQIKVGERAIKRCVRRWAKILLFPDNKPTIISNTETRIDYTKKRKKGNPIYIIRTYRVCLIQPNDTIYQVSGVSETIARRALALAAYRMPIKTEFVYILTYV